MILLDWGSESDDGQASAYPFEQQTHLLLDLDDVLLAVGIILFSAMFSSIRPLPISKWTPSSRLWHLVQLVISVDVLNPSNCAIINCSD